MRFLQPLYPSANRWGRSEIVGDRLLRRQGAQLLRGWAPEVHPIPTVRQELSLLPTMLIATLGPTFLRRRIVLVLLHGTQPNILGPPCISLVSGMHWRYRGQSKRGCSRG